MKNSSPVRVALIDDHSIVRKGLSAILNTNKEVQLVGEAEDGQQGIELCELTQPDVVLMDLIMPRMDGIEATRVIHQRWPNIQVLVLTSFTEKEMIQGALDAGAHGYLLKNVKGRELVDAILEVHQGRQTIAQEARQTLHLSEQLSMLEMEINEATLSTALVSESLNKRLPSIFPNTQIQIMLYPDQALFTNPAQIQTPLPERGWKWLRDAGGLNIFYHNQATPWGDKLTWGKFLLLKSFQGTNQAKPIGGICLLSEDIPSDVNDLVTATNSLADMLAIVLDKESVSTLEMENKRDSDELQMAGMLQSRILPEKPPRLSGWDIATQLLPARETSGDFYDFIPLTNDKWGILIADVTDKGLGAAVFMAMCSSLIRTYAVRFPTLPALTLSSVNERIFTDMRGGLFLTAFYGILEPHTGRLRYVNAGHNPPILFGNLKGKPLDKLPLTGMALGVSEDATWGQKMVKFAPGDVLVMYTDGITEAHNREGTFYGEIRLQESIRSHRQQSSAEILNTILAEVKHFTQDAPNQDDMALVILSRKR